MCYINLVSRTDRRLQMEAALPLAGLTDATRVDALTCAGLEDLCTPSLEMTLFACRPDIVVVTTNKFPKTVEVNH